MKFIRKNRSKAPALAMTSMMDIIFLLLCFFVTVSVFSQWESEISIKLPSATTATDPDRLPGEIIINLAQNGEIKINGHVLTHAQLKGKLEKVSQFYPGQPVIIRADKTTAYEKVVRVIDTCRSANIWNFSLATEQVNGK